MLRDYQERIIEQTREKLRTHRKPVIVAPTGSGKTHIATAIVKRCCGNGARTLFLAPRRELIYQTLERFEDAGIESGMIMAGEPQRLYARHQVASFDTLHARGMRNDKIVMPTADVVIVDEAHLSMSSSKLAILQHYTNSIVIGLTATPCRSDGTGLGNYYDSMVNEVSVRQLIDDGYLVEPAYYAPDEYDLTGVKSTKSDYVVSSLAKAVDQPELIGGIFDNWMRITGGSKSTVIFCCNRAHSRHINEEFNRRGIKSEHIDGETPKEERKGILERVKSGETTVVTNCMVYTYGIDLPILECVILARPTKSTSLYLQACGRGLRPSPGKDTCTIIDHTGAIKMHGFLDDHVPWTLDGGDIRELKKQQDEKNKEPKELVCTSCGNVWKGQRECTRCGKPMVPPSEPVPFKKADLKPVKKDNPVSFYAQLKAYGMIKGYKAGWAKHKYHQRYKTWPRIEPAPITPSVEVQNWVKSKNIAYYYARNSKSR